MRKTSVTDRQTDGLTGRLTECKPIVPPGFTGGGLKRNNNRGKVFGILSSTDHIIAIHNFHFLAFCPQRQ